MSFLPINSRVIYICVYTYALPLSWHLNAVQEDVSLKRLMQASRLKSLDLARARLPSPSTRNAINVNVINGVTVSSPSRDVTSGGGGGRKEGWDTLLAVTAESRWAIPSPPYRCKMSVLLLRCLLRMRAIVWFIGNVCVRVQTELSLPSGIIATPAIH